MKNWLDHNYGYIIVLLAFYLCNAIAYNRHLEKDNEFLKLPGTLIIPEMQKVIRSELQGKIVIYDYTQHD